MGENDPKLVGHSEPNEVSARFVAHEDDSAEQGREDVVEMGTCHDHFGRERRFEQAQVRQTGTQQRVRGDRSGHGRCGASSLSSRERKPLRIRISIDASGFPAS